MNVRCSSSGLLRGLRVSAVNQPPPSHSRITNLLGFNITRAVKKSADETPISSLSPEALAWLAGNDTQSQAASLTNAYRLLLASRTQVGYTLPGTTPGPGQTPLPDDLEQACVEQIAYWFQNRKYRGLKTYWAALSHYRRWCL